MHFGQSFEQLSTPSSEDQAEVFSKRVTLSSHGKPKAKDAFCWNHRTWTLLRVMKSCFKDTCLVWNLNHVLTPITQIDNETQVRLTQEAFWACGGCHERESGQEKVVRHHLCKARMWEQSTREKGGGGARPARAQEREREGAQGPRERRRKRGREAHARERAHAREKEWDQSPRCRTRRVSVTERRPWKSEHPPPPPECSGIGWLTKRDNEARPADDRQELWSGVGGWEKKQYEGKLCSQALSEKTDAPELGTTVSTCSPSTRGELSSRTRHNQNNRRSLAFDPSRRTIRTDTRMCSPLGGHKSKSGSLSFSLNWASAAAPSVSSTVLYSTSCRRFYGMISILCEAKKKMGTKSSSDDDEEVLQLSEVIIRRVKWSCKCLLERRGLKMTRFFEKCEKPPFLDLFPVNRCVNDVKRVCRGRIEAALPRLSRCTARKPDGWISDWCHSFSQKQLHWLWKFHFWVKFPFNAGIRCDTLPLCIITTSNRTS